MRPDWAHRPFSGAPHARTLHQRPRLVILIVILLVLGIIVLLRHLVR